MRLDHHRAAAARRGAPAPAVRLCAPSGASEPFVHTRPDGHGAVEHGGARYAPRDLLDTTPARLHPLDLSCGGGFLSSPDPADHEPWDRPLFRRVVVRPMERLASRFALVSPRPLLIGLIAILAKEIATRQIETDLLNTPDDAVWKPSALGIVRQAQANLDRRIKLIVRKGYAAMLDDELRAVREDPIGAILHSNLLGEASTIFSRQVSNVTMELASSIEDQVIESLELISTGLPDEDDADTQPAHAQPAALAVAARGGAGAAAVDGAGAYGDGGGAQRPWYWLWPVRLTLQPRPTRPRVPVHRPAVDFGADGGDGDGDGPNAIERVAEASDRVSGPEVALRAARVGASSAAVEWAHRAEAGASDRTSVARAGAARADARPRVGQPELLLLPPPPTGRERVRGFVRRAWAGATAGAGRGLSDVRAAALSALGGLPSFGWGVGVSVGAAARAQPPPLLALPQEAVRSRLRNLLARVDALVKRVDRDGNDELTLDELLALIYDDAQQPAPWGVPGARGAAGETRRFAPAAVAWAEGLDAETIAAIRSMVLIKATSRARTVWDRLQAIALAPIVVALNQTGVTARASVVRFGEYVSDADLNGDGELTADEVCAARAPPRCCGAVRRGALSDHRPSRTVSDHLGHSRTMLGHSRTMLGPSRTISPAPTTHPPTHPPPPPRCAGAAGAPRRRRAAVRAAAHAAEHVGRLRRARRAVPLVAVRARRARRAGARRPQLDGRRALDGARDQHDRPRERALRRARRQRVGRWRHRARARGEARRACARARAARAGGRCGGQRRGRRGQRRDGARSGCAEPAARHGS